MINDSFSSKEILVQLMAKIDGINTTLNRQDGLLSAIHEQSAGRDEKIRDLKKQVETLQTEMSILTVKVQSLGSFNKIVLTIWSGFILLVSLFGEKIFNHIF